MAKRHVFPYLKKFSKHRFQQVFKQILWNHQISLGAKVYAFALLTIPPQTRIKQKKMASKLKVDPATVSRWFTQIKKSNLRIRGIEPVEQE